MDTESIGRVLGVRKVISTLEIAFARNAATTFAPRRIVARNVARMHEWEMEDIVLCCTNQMVQSFA